MKKFYALFLVLFLSACFSQVVLAEDGELDGYTRGVDNAWYGQKPVTDEQFDKAMKKLKDKKDRKMNKPLKGQSVSKDEHHNEYLNDMADKNIILLLPLDLVTPDGSEIIMGHYKVVGKKIKDKVYLDFYQSSTLEASIEATETNNDFGEKTINFVKVLPYDEKRIKIIYGSLDFNAYTFVNIKNTLN